MKKKATFFVEAGLLNLLLLFAPYLGFSQTRTVTGNITNRQDNTPLPGVSVTVKGSTRGTSTNASGKFSIAVPSPDAVLVFTSTGFEPQEIKVGSQSEVNLALQ